MRVRFLVNGVSHAKWPAGVVVAAAALWRPGDGGSHAFRCCWRPYGGSHVNRASRLVTRLNGGSHAFFQGECWLMPRNHALVGALCDCVC